MKLIFLAVKRDAELKSEIGFEIFFNGFKVIRKEIQPIKRFLRITEMIEDISNPIPKMSSALRFTSRKMIH